MRIPWYIHGNWKLDPTQLQTLEKDILRVGVTQEKEQVITTYHAKDKDLECLDFLYNFYKERVDEISKDQLFFHTSKIHFVFWIQVYNKLSYHPIHDHFDCGNDTVLSFVHFLKPVENCFEFTDERQSLVPQQQEGDLIVFPSYVTHRVKQHNANTNRIVVAGNIKIDQHIKLS